MFLRRLLACESRGKAEQPQQEPTQPTPPQPSVSLSGSSSLQLFPKPSLLESEADSKAEKRVIECLVRMVVMALNNSKNALLRQNFVLSLLEQLNLFYERTRAYNSVRLPVPLANLQRSVLFRLRLLAPVLKYIQRDKQQFKYEEIGVALFRLLGSDIIQAEDDGEDLVGWILDAISILFQDFERKDKGSRSEDALIARLQVRTVK